MTISNKSKTMICLLLRLLFVAFLWSGTVTTLSGQTNQIKDLRQSSSAKDYDRPNETIETVRLYRGVLENPKADSISKLTALKQLTNLYSSVGDIESAISIRDRMNSWVKDSTIAMQWNLQLAQFLIQAEDFETAKSVLSQVFTYFKRQDKSGLLWLAKVRGAEAIILVAEGYLDAAQGKHNEAWRFLNEYRKACSVGMDEPKLADIECTLLNNAADLLIKRGKYNDAIMLLGKTGPLLLYTRESTQAVVSISYAQAYQGLSKQSDAKSYFTKGISMIDNNGFKYLNHVYLDFARFLASESDHKEATLYFERYIKNSEEVNTKARMQQLGYAKSQYLLEKKDKEIIAAELNLFKKKQELDAQRTHTYFWVGGSIVLALLSILLFKNIRNKTRFLKTRAKIEHTERAISEAEGVLKGEHMERTRIAKELHDNVVSELTILKLNLESLYRQTDNVATAASTKVTLLHSTEILEQLRRTAHNMMPDEDGQRPLFQQVSVFLSRLAIGNVKFDYQVVGEEPALSLHKKKIVLTIVKELANNVLKHSKATEALVELNFCPGLLMLTVEDNGVGIALNSESHTDGMGWKNIQENTLLLQGSFDIKVSEHEGSNILIEIPL